MKICFLAVTSILATLLLPHDGFSAIPKFSSTEGSVNFLAVGKPSMLKIHGKAPGPKSNLQFENGKLKGVAEFALDSLDTGIALRNQHMKEKYLKTKEFPLAILTLMDTDVGAEFPQTLTVEGEKPFQGKLKLHGVEKDVSGKFTGKEGKISASFQVKISDFGIEVPSYLGVTVTDTVDITVDLALKKEGV